MEEEPLSEAYDETDDLGEVHDLNEIAPDYDWDAAKFFLWSEELSKDSEKLVQLRSPWMKDTRSAYAIVEARAVVDGEARLFGLGTTSKLKQLADKVNPKVGDHFIVGMDADGDVYFREPRPDEVPDDD